MLIDWFTVAAQLVNFLILVWLLRRFLYQPVLKALEERERTIAARLEHAGAAEQEAEQRRSEWERKNAEIEQSRRQLLLDAEDDAQKARNTLLEESRKAGDELRARLEDSIRREREEIAAETARRIEDAVFSLAGKVLEELADASVEDRIVSRFCTKLMAADEETLAIMVRPFGKSWPHAVVRSRFTLDDRQRALIGEAVRNRLSAELHLEFEAADERHATGIELCLDGHCISWTINAALEELKGLSSTAEVSSKGI